MKLRGLAFFMCVYDEPSTDLCLHKSLYLVYLARIKRFDGREKNC